MKQQLIESTKIKSLLENLTEKYNILTQELKVRDSDISKSEVIRTKLEVIMSIYYNIIVLRFILII